MEPSMHDKRSVAEVTLTHATVSGSCLWDDETHLNSIDWNFRIKCSVSSLENPKLFGQESFDDLF